MAKYLVTGGAGFIGSHIVETLLEKGESVRVFDNFRTGKRENLEPFRSKIEIREGDIRDAEAVRKAAEGMDFLLHQAALVSVVESIARPQETMDINVIGTLNVLEAARAAGVKRVVLASSCAVYGDGPVPAREEQQLTPLSPYAASKLAGEGLACSFFRSYGLPAVSLRYFNVFGARQDPTSPYSGVIAIFSQRVTESKPICVYGDGRQTRDFIFVKDVARANILACAAPEAAGKSWNVGTGSGISLLQLLADLEYLTGNKIIPEFGPTREGEIIHSRCDTSQASARLGFLAQTPFRDGLRQTLAWYNGQG